MSLFAALMLAQAAAPSAALEDQIVVMAERIRAIEVSVGQDQAGRWHCSTSQSSGNARVDDQLCRATTACSQRHGNDREALEQCIDRRRPGILEDFREELRRSSNA